VFASDGDKETSLGLRKAGEVLGEMTMLREYNHEWSARSSGKTELLYIPRDVIGPIISSNPTARAFIADRVAISSAGGLISHLFDLKSKVDKGELEALTRSVGVKRVGAGKEILKQGAKEDRRLYVVRDGEVRVIRHEEGKEYLLATLRKGETFGERACLMRQEQGASIVANNGYNRSRDTEKAVHLILERNPKVREALQERIRIHNRELQRQMKVAELRRPKLIVDLKSKPELGENVIRRFAWIQQAEEMDCGAACLAMICKHYGIGMTLGKLRELPTSQPKVQR